MAVFTTTDRMRMEAEAGIKFSNRNPNVFVIEHGASRKVEEPMSERGLVIFSEGSRVYGVYLPANGFPLNVRGAINSCTMNLRLSGGSITAAELAAELIAKVRNYTGCRARLGEDYGDTQLITDFVYYINIANGVVANVEVHTRVNGINKTLLYNGSISNWDGRATIEQKLAALTGKIIAFDYSAGTKPGRRIVRLESVYGSGANVRLYGKDVEKDEPRSFLLSKIKGEPKLV